MILGDHFTPMMPFIPDVSGVFQSESVSISEARVCQMVLNAWQRY